MGSHTKSGEARRREKEKRMEIRALAKTDLRNVLKSNDRKRKAIREAQAWVAREREQNYRSRMRGGGREGEAYQKYLRENAARQRVKYAEQKKAERALFDIWIVKLGMKRAGGEGASGEVMTPSELMAETGMDYNWVRRLLRYAKGERHHNERIG